LVKSEKDAKIIERLSMTQTPSKRRNSLIAVVIIVVLVVSSIGAIFYLLTYDNVTVSGNARVTYLPITIIQTIEFMDTQTGASTTFQFHQALGGADYYSVTLKNGHTYNVYISFSVMNPQGKVEKEFITTFTVNTAAGQKEITEDFQYPNPPT
jgi:hypothetical protein